MRLLRAWLMRVADLFIRSRRERELADELESHIQIHTDDNIRAGMAPDEARRAALAKLGGIASVQESYREQRGVPLFTHVAQDVRYALRTFARSPGVTFVALVTLAFGIAGPTLMFTMLKAWVLEPLPFPNSKALVDVRGVDIQSGDMRSLTAADFLDWQRTAHTIETLAAYRFQDVRLTGGDRPDRLHGARVTSNFFDVLGVQPALGRLFGPVDNEPGRSRVAVLAHGLWQERFQSDPAVVGRTVRLDNEVYTIVGVMAADFHFTLLGRVNIWTPLVFTPEESANRRVRSVVAVGRLGAGYSVDQARDELAGVARQLAAAHPDTNGNRGARVLLLADEVRRHHDAGFLVPILFAMVGCVLLIACVNVTNIMLARATARRHEMAVRLALGASKSRIIRQWLVEHVALFAVASAIGIGLAIYGADWVTNSIPFENRGYLRNYGKLPVDAVVLLFAMGVGTACGMLFGCLPAWTGAKADVNLDLRDAPGRTATSQAAGRLRSTLVACEVALALGLLVSSALLVQTARNLTRVDLGFDPQRLLTFQLGLDEQQYRTPAAARDFYERLMASLQGRPGIVSACAGSLVPFSDGGGSIEFFIEGLPVPAPKDTPASALNQVTPGYATTLGLRLVQGRFIEAGDIADGPRAAVINETLARRYFPGADPIGRRLRLGRSSEDFWTIVGVVADVKNYEPADASEPQTYVSLAQRPAREMTVVIRTSGDPEALTDTVRSAVGALDPAEPLSRIFTMQALIGHVTAPYITTSTFVTFFGGLTLLLAAVGVYGVISYAFAQRTREIGIRMALGARRIAVAALVLKQVRTLLLAGLGPGLLLAWGLSNALEAFLFGVHATDWRVYVAMCGALAAVALIAAFVPARRATAVDPVTALRYE